MTLLGYAAHFSHPRKCGLSWCFVMRVCNGYFYNLDAMHLMASLPSESIDCIVTDPPYRVIGGGKNSPLGYGYRNSVLSENNGKIFQHNDTPASAYLPEFYRLLKSGSHCYVMTNVLNLRDMLNIAAECGFQLHNLLIWQKNTGTANRWYMKFAEYTLFLRKGPARTINNPGSSNVFAANNPRNKAHPTEKPVELMEHYITNSTQPGEIVFDPFAGSGATLIAAQQSGRQWIGCEIDPIYYYPTYCRLVGL